MTPLAFLALALIPSVTATDLSDLFGAPSIADLLAVEADWDSRNPIADGWQVEATGTVAGYRVDIASHIVDGYRHYGAVRFPAQFQPGGSHPVLVVCHGGNNGVGLGALPGFDALTPATCVEDDAFILLPSYRGEILVAGGMGTYLSEGPTSVIDRDVDDTMGMIACVLEEIPEADDQRIFAHGGSRGAAVTLLLAVRDERIQAAVEFFGASDHTLPSIQAECEALADAGGGSGSNAVSNHAWIYAAEPYLAGTLSLAEARQVLHACSMAFFAHRLPPLQVHHGTADGVVLFEQSERLVDAMTELGVGTPCFEFFAYAGGVHNPGSLTGAGALLETFLCDAMSGQLDLDPCDCKTWAYCEVNPNTAGAGASMTYSGSTSVVADDLVLGCVGLPAGKPGLFFHGPNRNSLTLGEGTLCIGGSLTRLPVVLTSAAGEASWDLDVAAEGFLAGESVNFQFWFRDPGGGPFGNNLSDGLGVLFCP
jgi:hypothetical protein